MERIVVWKLDSLINIEILHQLLSRNHNKTIQFLEGTNIEPVERTLRNRWTPTDPNNKFEIQEGSILGQEFKYIYALGSYEYSLGEKKSYINDILLDRDLRVFNKTCKAVFFDYNSDVYVAVQTNKSNETTIRSSLMGQAKGSGKIEEWGKIDSTVHLPFAFTSDFFYWLLSKKGTAIERDDQHIEVHDVCAVAVFSDHENYNTSSEGEGLLDGSVGALSVLSTNERIRNVGLILKVGKYNLDFRFNHCSEILIDESNTFKSEYDDLGNEIGIIKYEDTSNEFVVLLFTIIFPILIEEFSNDATWDTAANLSQQKIWAKNVIKRLMQHSNINLQELEENVDAEHENVV